MSVSGELKALHDAISFQNAGTSREERIKIMEAAAGAIGKQRIITPGAEYLMKLLPIGRRFVVSRHEDEVKFYGMNDLEPIGRGVTLEDAIASHICYRMESELVGSKPSEKPEPTTRPKPLKKINSNGGGNSHEVDVGGVIYPSKKAALLDLFRGGKLPEENSMQAAEIFYEEMSRLVGCSSSYVKENLFKFFREG